MPRGKKYGPEVIIPKLREAEVLTSQGTSQELAAKKIGVSVQTLIRWRKEYGGCSISETVGTAWTSQDDGRTGRNGNSAEPAARTPTEQAAS